MIAQAAEPEMSREEMRTQIVDCPRCEDTEQAGWDDDGEQCALCMGAGQVAAGAAHDWAADDGETPCPLPMSACVDCVDSAVDAGIPRDVAMGKRKLTPADYARAGVEMPDRGEDCGYDIDDPKHPDYAERAADRADMLRDRARDGQ